MFELSLLQREVSHLLDLELAGSGLNSEDFAVYSALSRGLTRPGEIASFLHFPPTTVSSAISRLASRGHVSYEIDAADRRARRVTLTSAGLDAHKEATRLFDLAVNRLALPPSADSLEFVLVEMRIAIAEAQSTATRRAVRVGSGKLA